MKDLQFRRTVEQMVQASRSGKQNIVEGVGQSQISKKGEIKLLGVAKASLEELISDFEDFLRQKLKLSGEPESATNLLLTFCHMVTYLLDRQIKKAEESFVQKGGFSENLLRKRLNYRIK